MITAIVLVETDVARIPEAAQAIAELEGVSEVYSVTGDVDLVATDAHGEDGLRADQLAKELDDRLTAALRTAAASVDDGGAAATLDRWVDAARD